MTTVYQVVIGQEEFDPFEGFPTEFSHKTLKGAWKEVSHILEYEYFMKQSMGEIQILDIDINVNARLIGISYKRMGFPLEDMFASIYIAKQILVL